MIEPGVLMLTKVSQLNDMVDGDAKVSGPMQTPRETQAGPARMAACSAAGPPGTKIRKANRSGRVRQVSDGKYTLNRTGYKLCEAYQSGECSGTTNGIWCSQSWDTTHQRRKSLGNHAGKH